MVSYNDKIISFTANTLIEYAFVKSETIKPNGEPCIPLRKLRNCIELYKIQEESFKEHMYGRNSQFHPYIDTLMQKLYHPTKEDLETDEMLMNGMKLI